MDKKPKDSEEPEEPDANYDGVLVYLKPSLFSDEPRDVLNYHASSKTFPEETIADQWFSEPQFESYRALGNHMIATICAAVPASTSAPIASEPTDPKSTLAKGAPTIDDRIRAVIEALQVQPSSVCGEAAGFAARAVGHVERGEGQRPKK